MLAENLRSAARNLDQTARSVSAGCTRSGATGTSAPVVANAPDCV
ncbi:hypothetical protein [Terasakiella pusilla]